MAISPYDLKPFDGLPGVPHWVVDMASRMDKDTVETQTGQWLVRKTELGRIEFYLFVAEAKR